MSASFTGSRLGDGRSAAGRGARYRARHWPGWPAVTVGGRVVGIGFLLLTLVLVAGGLVISHALAHSVGRWDDHINALFASHRTPTDNRITGDFTVFANAPAVIGVALVVSVVAALCHRARLAALVVLGLVIEVAVFLTSSYIVGRPRPHEPHLGSTPSTYSWPSGHVAAIFVLYGGIALIITMTTSRVLPRVFAWVAAAAITTCVGLSRIYRGDHHPTDAIAGLLLGAGALFVGSLAVRVWARCVQRSTQSATAPASTENADEIAGVA